jgi:hypothetical protein
MGGKMRIAISLILMLGFMLSVVGCGSSEEDAKGGGEEDTDQVAQVLRIEARGSGSEYTLHLNGADEATSLEGVAQALGAHAISTEGNLEGPDERGISRNPVRFSAGMNVSSRAFLEVVEQVALASIIHIECELVLPEGEPRRFEYELPYDEGMTGGIMTRERENGATPRPALPLRLNVMPVGNEGVNYMLTYGNHMRRPVHDTGVARRLVSRFTPDDYNAVRENLADEVAKYAREMDNPVSGLEINLRTTEGFAPWVGAFAAYEALSSIRREDGERWHVSWTHPSVND